MQRRAAAVYFALFVFLGAGALMFMQVGMSQPPVDLDGPSYGEGDELSVGGATYNVSSIEADTSGGEFTRSINVTRFNESFRTSTIVENDSSVQRDGTEYAVVVGGDANSFRLVEQFNVSAILADDEDVEDETATQGGTEYVFYTDGTREPLSEYLPEPDVQGPYGVGDQLQWPAGDEAVTATVDAVGSESVTLTWEAPQVEGRVVEEGGNLTLAGTQYFAHFRSNSSVQLLPTEEYYTQYQADISAQDYYQERQNGFWGVVYLSLFGAILLFTAAYLPTKG